jgi:3-hydroxybutyrate dehydrogenase
MSQPVAGKVAIVTGAGSGINLAFASALLAKGCNVVLADLGLRPEAEGVVNAHRSNDGSCGRAVFQKTDVRDWPQLERMFVTAEREFGHIDIVCPGAGVYEPVSPGSLSSVTWMCWA